MIENDDSIGIIETSVNFKGTTHELRGAPSERSVQLSIRKTALLSALHIGKAVFLSIGN
jgi:hypothetical protein